MTARTIMIARDIERSLDRISLEIVERNHGVADLSIVGIHTGGVFLAQRIKRQIEEREEVIAACRQPRHHPVPGRLEPHFSESDRQEIGYRFSSGR